MKKKVVRKLMALALVSAMATSMLAGCGSGDDSGKDSGKDADKGSEETVLKVAAFEGGNGTQIWEDIAKAFEESHDGVKVELEINLRSKRISQDVKRWAFRICRPCTSMVN